MAAECQKSPETPKSVIFAA